MLCASDDKFELKLLRPLTLPARLRDQSLFALNIGIEISATLVLILNYHQLSPIDITVGFLTLIGGTAWLMEGLSIWNHHPGEITNTILERSSDTAFEPVAVWIPAVNEPLSVITECLDAALEIKGRGSIYLLDDGQRPELAELAKTRNVRYVTRTQKLNGKSGNLQNALQLTTEKYALILDCDHLASRRILEKLMPYFSDDQVACVQPICCHHNKASFEHHRMVLRPGQIWHQLAYHRFIAAPWQANYQCRFWGGSGAILNLGAIRQVGGFCSQMTLDDMDLSLILMSRDFRIAQVREVLTRDMATIDVRGFRQQRAKWSSGRIQVAMHWLSQSARPIKLRVRLFLISQICARLLEGISSAGCLLVPIMYLAGSHNDNDDRLIFLSVVVAAMISRQVSMYFLSRGTYGGIQSARINAVLFSQHFDFLVNLLRGAKTIYNPTKKVALAPEQSGLLKEPILTLLLVGNLVAIAIFYIRLASCHSMAAMTIFIAIANSAVLTVALYDCFKLSNDSGQKNVY